MGIPRASRSNTPQPTATAATATATATATGTTNTAGVATGKVRIERNKRPPSTPLPSILSDESSQDEMSINDIFSQPQDGMCHVASASPPSESDEEVNLPPPPPELMINNEPYLEDDDPYMGSNEPYMGNFRNKHVESDYENDFQVESDYENDFP